MADLLQPEDSLKTSLSTPKIKVAPGLTGQVESNFLSAKQKQSGIGGDIKQQAQSSQQIYRFKQELVNEIPMRHPADSVQVTLATVPATIGLTLPERKMASRSADWVLGVLILALILFTSVRLFFGKYLTQLFHASVNYSTASRLFRERSVSVTHAAFRLDLIFLLSISLFLFQIFGKQLSFGINSSFLRYLVILAGVIVYFGVKQVLYSVQGKLTESNAETQEVLFNLNLYNRILGLVLVPVTLIFAFSRLPNPEILVGIGGIMVLLSYILLVLRGLNILLRKDFPIFYLILYLCTLEILPLFYIYKLVLV